MSTSPERQMAALVEAGMTLASELELDVLLQRIADLSCEVVGAKYAAVGVLGDDSSLVRFVWSGIDDAAAHRIGDLPQGRGVLGVLIDEGRPLRLRDIADHPRSYGFPPHHPPMRSFLGVPIVVRSRVFGRLYLTEKQGAPEFTKDDERIALTLAAQAGVAVDNARLLEEVRARGEELAVLEERDRISKELHDGVIQSIYSVGLSLQSALSVGARDPDTVAKRINDAIAELDNVVRDVRNYIFALQPKLVEGRSLKQAVAELARDLEVNTLATVTMLIDDDSSDALSEAQRTDLIQAVREVLSNIARHAQAGEVEISCSRSDGEIVLEISDDGVGFDPSTVRRGQGLTNIEERTRRLGGRFDVLPNERRGTRHVIRVPIAPEGEADE